jgi:hypothetical protein
VAEGKAKQRFSDELVEPIDAEEALRRVYVELKRLAGESYFGEVTITFRDGIAGLVTTKTVVKISEL